MEIITILIFSQQSLESPHPPSGPQSGEGLGMRVEGLAQLLYLGIGDKSE